MPEKGFDQLLSLNQVSEQLGICYRTARRLVARGELPAVRIGNKVLRVRAADVEALKSPVGGAS